MRTPTTSTTYGDLVNGDQVWIEGHLFVVRNVRVVSAYMCMSEGYGPGRPVVRFEGGVVDASSDIAGTGYDGGTYGAIPTHHAVIVARG
jgi:hypothetical protein